jgi:serine protease inhibitor
LALRRGLIMRISSKVLVLLSIGLALTQCTDRRSSPTGPDPSTDTTMRQRLHFDESLLTRRQLATLGNEFGFRLFKGMVGERPDENVFISPLSVSMALGMVVNGAAGETRDAILSTLGIDGYPMEMVNACYRSLIDNLVGMDPQADFEIANSVWCRAGVTFEDAFLNACRTHFDAEVRSLDFSDPGAADTINAWVDEKTLGYIPEIVETPIDPEVVMILLNALNFWGTWTYRFDPMLTHDDWFHLPDGSQTLCRMMQRPDPDLPFDPPGCKYAYLRYDYLFEAVELPYGDSLFSMIVVLPWPGVHVDSVIAVLNQDDWGVWMNSFCRRHTYGIVSMPRYELEFACDMNDALSALGMEIAFVPGQADFSAMSSYMLLWISKVKHKTYVHVDEGGTIAAAVTEVDISTGINPCPDYFELCVDRPFVVAIRENRWGNIIFIGKIVDPGYLL